MIAGFFFYLFALILLGSATATLCARQPVHAVLFLVLAFFNAAGILLTLGAELLAFLLLIVYVGAVAVLFLFVVMMLDVRQGPELVPLRRFGRVGLGVGLVLGAQLVAVASLWPQGAPLEPLDGGMGSIRALGETLYTGAMLPFQLSGLVLLTAIVGAIALAHSRRVRAKRQNIAAQLAASPREIVRLHDVKIGEGAE